MSREQFQQTGGSKKTWVFDPSQLEEIAPIRAQLTAMSAEDQYFETEYGTNTLALVMDKVLDDLPKDIADAVRLVHLKGMSLRSAAKILGADHKTIKLRVTKGVDMMRKRLVDSVWIAEMLSGYIPKDEYVPLMPAGNKVSDILKTLKEPTDEQE
jgi:DNA-directed RNA polymerase specialized sigma24 family protein